MANDLNLTPFDASNLPWLKPVDLMDTYEKGVKFNEGRELHATSLMERKQRMELDLKQEGRAVEAHGSNMQGASQARDIAKGTYEMSNRVGESNLKKAEADLITAKQAFEFAKTDEARKAAGFEIERLGKKITNTLNGLLVKDNVAYAAIQSKLIEWKDKMRAEVERQSSSGVFDTSTLPPEPHGLTGRAASEAFAFRDAIFASVSNKKSETNAELTKVKLRTALFNAKADGSYAEKGYPSAAEQMAGERAGIAKSQQKLVRLAFAKNKIPYPVDDAKFLRPDGLIDENEVNLEVQNVTNKKSDIADSKASIEKRTEIFRKTVKGYEDAIYKSEAVADIKPDTASVQRRAFDAAIKVLNITSIATEKELKAANLEEGTLFFYGGRLHATKKGANGVVPENPLKTELPKSGSQESKDRKRLRLGHQQSSGDASVPFFIPAYPPPPTNGIVPAMPAD